ncbi:unnamed protein product, partial [Rotaria magnacalcarata]
MFKNRIIQINLELENKRTKIDSRISMTIVSNIRILSTVTRFYQIYSANSSSIAHISMQG